MKVLRLRKRKGNYEDVWKQNERRVEEVHGVFYLGRFKCSGGQELKIDKKIGGLGEQVIVV